MDEAVEPVTPLSVDRVALTTINVPDETGAASLFPVVGVWADLTPLREAGVEFAQPGARTLPVVVITDAVLDPTNPTVANIVVAQAHDEPDDDQFEDGFEVSPFGPHWSLRVPTAWVGMATVVVGSPLQMRMLLIDGPAPLLPEAHTLTLAEAGAVVMPTVRGVSQALAAAMGPEWTAPIPVRMTHLHDAPEVNLMRDQLWATIAGIALGQERALNRAVSFAEWARLLPGGDAEEQAKYDAVMQAAEWVAESSQLEPLVRDQTGAVVWPAAMTSLAEKIGDLADDTVLDSMDHGLLFEDAVETYGFDAALIGLCVMTAAKAHTAVAHPDGPPGQRFTPSYLLGMWLDEESEEPWWATRATHHLLLHHDTDVLVDLLTANGSTGDLTDGHGPLATRFFHVVTEALASLNMSVDEFTENLHRLDITLPEMDDIVYVAKRLLGVCIEETNSDRDECPGCVAVEQVVTETTDQYRLVRAVVGALPVLADLDAALAGLGVGEEEWKSHREGFLMHWMNHTAIHPSVEA